MYEDELKVISQAILNEIEGYEFYNLASAHGSAGSKEAFKELANEELEHVSFLKDLYNKIKTSENDDIRLAFEVQVPSPEIYKWDKVNEQLSTLAMSVFSIGIQMEKDSIEFYEKAKAETKLDAARELYDLLIKWEIVHLEQFEGQYNFHKKEWWAEQGFEPF
jgi:rubrerythrin